MNTPAGRFTAVLLAAAFLVPAALSAQAHQEHHPRTDEARANPGMMGGGMMSQQSDMMSSQTTRSMMHSGPRMLLRQRDALELSEDQVEQLEQLRARAEELRSTHRSPMASIRKQLQELHGSEAPDLERYEALLREQADLRVDMRVQAAEVHRDALQVLTDEQRSNVRYGMRMMRSMHSKGGMSGSGSGMMDMKNWMGRSQMMGMMKGMHRQMHGQDCPATSSQDGATGG